jgi:signal transduction histidine kinase
VRSLWFKLTAALVLVTLLGVGLSVLVPGLITVRNFQSFVDRSRLTEQQEWVAALAVYYESQGSWEGIDSLWVRSSERRGHMMGPMIVPGMIRPWSFQLADEHGVVIAAARSENIGQQLSRSQLQSSVAIEVQGQRVGFVAPGPTMSALREPESTFLRQVGQTLVPVGMVACAVAILLGLLITWQLTGPLRKLKTAALGIAGGDLSQRVDLKSKDEIGDLGRAFNDMAENLAHAEELRQNMTADIAHELRTPLSVIRGNLEAILDGVFEPTKENVVSIHKQAILLSRLVDDLQELALADAGQLRIEREPTDLSALIQRTISAIAPRAEQDGVALFTDLAQDLPTLSADPQRLSQVLGNLLDNAVQHSPEGGTITVRATTAGENVRVDVVDQGPGLTAEELSLVFERFYRGDEARTRATGGAGLGLAIVKQLVEAHGGRAWAESVEGEGTTFSFIVPVGSPETT